MIIHQKCISLLGKKELFEGFARGVSYLNKGKYKQFDGTRNEYTLIINSLKKYFIIQGRG